MEIPISSSPTFFYTHGSTIYSVLYLLLLFILENYLSFFMTFQYYMTINLIYLIIKSFSPNTALRYLRREGIDKKNVICVHVVWWE